MSEFSISRIHTPFGIFRLNGQLESKHTEQKLTFTHLEIMGTDGWVELNVNAEDNNKLLLDIRADVILHLSKKN